MSVASVPPVRRVRPAVVVLAVCCAAWIAAACAGDGPTGPTTPVVASIQVSPGADTLIALGRTRTYTAVARDAQGVALPGAVIRWASSDTLIARVDSVSGVVTAVRGGAASISATSGSVSGSGLVAVIQVVAAVQVTPGTVGLAAIGSTQPYTAVARDSMNAVVPGVRFLWLSSNPSVASIDTNGVATAVGAGAAIISATGRGIPAYAALSVTQAATALQFTVEPASKVRAGDAFSTAIQVEVRDAGGNRVRDSRVAVTLLPLSPSAPPLVGAATVNAVDGIATFSNVSLTLPQTTRLRATAVGLLPDTSATFTVAPGLPTQVSFLVDPEPAFEVGVGSSGYMVLTYLDAFGNIADTTPPSPLIDLLDATGTPVAYATSAPDRSSPGNIGFQTLTFRRPGTGFTFRQRASIAGRWIDARSQPFTVGATLGAVSIGSAHACAKGTGGILCWGSNAGNLLGRSTFPATQDSVAALIDIAGTFTAVVATDIRSCGLRDDGGVVCWGAGTTGLVPGTGPTGTVMTQLSASSGFACAVSSAGAVFCWGEGGAGQLGNGANLNSSTPVQVVGSGSGDRIFTQVSTGLNSACGVTTSKNAYCWGYNGSGQLGDSSQVSTNQPTLVHLSGTGSLLFTSIAVNTLESTCATTVGGSLFCWGAGPRADGSNGAQTTPRRVIANPGGLAIVKVQLGLQHGCGLRETGTLVCWGLGGDGQLGPSGNAVTPIPATTIDVGGRAVLDFALGRAQTCARTSAGIYCWGDNTSGALGIGSTAQLRVWTPTRIIQ